MSIPLFYPPIRYERRIQSRHFRSVRQWCELAGVACKASGIWTQRRVAMRFGESWAIEAGPGPCGDVCITIPASHRDADLRQQARYTLAALAYGVFDLVAKASIKGQTWAWPAAPPGRPRSGTALSTAERQRRFRARQGSVGQ